MKKKLVITALVTGLLCALCAPSMAAIKWKWVHYQPVDSMVDVLSKKMIKEIQDRSKGEIQISLFPAAQLGDWMEMSDQIMRGSIQIGILPVTPAYNKSLLIRVLPYSVMNWKEAKEAFAGKNPFLLNIMTREMEKSGFKGFAVVAEGFGGAGFVRDPGFDVVDPDTDKHGYKIRVPAGNQAFESMATQFGFIPTSIPWGDTYIALQTGLIDCQIGNQPYNTFSSLLDVTKMYVQYNTHFQSSFVYMNKKAWDSLKPELQQIVSEVAKKYALTSFEMAEEEDKKYMEKMKSAGIKVIIPSDTQLAKLAKKVRTNTWPLMEKTIGKGIMDEVLAGLKSLQ